MEKVIRLGYLGKFCAPDGEVLWMPWFWGAYGLGIWESNIWTTECFNYIFYGDKKGVDHIGYRGLAESFWNYHNDGVRYEMDFYTRLIKQEKCFIVPVELRFWESERSNFLQTALLPDPLLDYIHTGKAAVVFHNLPEGSANVVWNRNINAFCQNNRLKKDEVYFLTANMKVFDIENFFTELKVDYFGREFWWTNKPDKEKALLSVDNRCKNTSSKKLFLCLNRREAPHRVYFSSFIETHPILKEKTAFSRWAANWPVDFTGESGDSFLDGRWKNLRGMDRISDFFKENWNKSIIRPLDPIGYKNEPWKSENRIDIAPAYADCLINIVTETICDQNDHVFLSEKTFKSIYAGMPFILVGTPGMLKALHELGYKTFGRWWDESYDEEEDLVVRFSKIAKLLEDLALKSSEEIAQMMQEMENVLKYNIEVLFTRYSVKSINKEILRIQNRSLFLNNKKKANLL